MKERTAALIKEGKNKKDAEAQATKELKDAYNSAYAYIVNQSKKAAEGKLNNISTYGNAAGASVDGLTRYSRNASGEISENTKGNLVYMKDLKLAGIVPKGNSKPYIPVEYVGDIRYLDNTLNGMSLGEVKYSSNMGGAHNSGKNSHYNGKLMLLQESLYQWNSIQGYIMKAGLEVAPVLLDTNTTLDKRLW